MKTLTRFATAIAAILALAAFYFYWAFLPPSAVEPLSETFTLRGVTVINPGVNRTPNATVIVKAGAFQDGTGDEGIPPGAPPELAQFAGMFVLPGLVNMHEHLPPDNPLKLTPYFLLLDMAHGVTAIRDAGDVDGTANSAAREGIESGEFPGPRMYTSGPFVGAGEPRWPNTMSLTSSLQADLAVEQLKAGGNSFVKFYEGLTPTMIRALEAACKKYGMGMLGHVPDNLTYEEARVPDTQHFLGVPMPEKAEGDSMLHRIAAWREVDDERLDAVVAATLQYGIANTPTLVSSAQLLSYRDYAAALENPAARLMPAFFPNVIWSPTEGMPIYRGLDQAYLDDVAASLDKKKKLLRMLHEKGATLHVGSDTLQPFVAPGLAVHQEMRLWEEAGIPAEAIWTYATAAAYKNIGDPTIGRIGAGLQADAIVFREDPTVSLAALDTIEAVILRGKLYTRAALDAKIAEFQNHYSAFPVGPLSKILARRALDKATN